MYLTGSWQPSLAEGSANFPIAVGSPGPVEFRVTVSYESGPAATSDPITITWLEPLPTPTPEPTATPTPEPTATPEPTPTATPEPTPTLTPEPTPTPTPLPLQVAITAHDPSTSPQAGEAIELQAVITNAPSGETPSYQWEMYLNGSWQASLAEGSANFPIAVGSPGPVEFRVTVSYEAGPAATSDPITITWLEPPPTPTPEPTATPTLEPTPTATPGPTPTPTPTPLSLWVAITASPENPPLDEATKLQAVISNSPSEKAPSYQWEMELGDTWHVYGRNSTFSYLVNVPQTQAFRVTVTYDTGETATSDPILVTWGELPPTPTPTATPTSEPTPTPEPTPVPNQVPEIDEQAAEYHNFVGTNNAPRGLLVSKSFHGVFSDPDGNELTFTVSVPADHSRLVQIVEIVKEAPQISDPDLFPRVFFQADADDDWNAIVPALSDPLTTTVTLTATDPDGLSVSLNGDFLTDWESHPVLLSVTADREGVKLTFNQAIQETPGPTADQFTVNVVNENETTGTIAVQSVTVNAAVVTLELASALVDGQTITLDYAHDDDTPLKRAAEGGDSTPGFTGKAVELSLIDPPGPAENFAGSATPGELNISATWDAVDGATSYKLSWRQADGNFEPGNESTVSDLTATITVSGYGQWVVQLEGCNDAGCGPGVAQTVSVTPSVQLNLAPALTTAGKLRARTITASWNSVPNAASYGLRWWRTETDSQAQA